MWGSSRLCGLQDSCKALSPLNPKPLKVRLGTLSVLDTKLKNEEGFTFQGLRLACKGCQPIAKAE